MTDHHDPSAAPDPSDGSADDELVSAVLDGEATVDEVARVEGDPELAARLERFRAVRDDLSVGSPPPEQVDDHVAAALAGFGADADHVGDIDHGDGTITPLSPERHGRPSRSGSDQPWYRRAPLGAAAAVAAVLVGLGVLTQVDLGGDPDDTVAGPAPASEDLDVAEPEAFDAPAGAGGGAAEEGAALGGSGTVGDAEPSFADFDALADYVETTTASRSTAAAAEDTADGGGDASAPQAPGDCDAAAAADVAPEDVLQMLAADVAGRRVIAVVTGDPDDAGRRLVVVDHATCDVVDERSL